MFACVCVCVRGQEDDVVTMRVVPFETAPAHFSRRVCLIFICFRGATIRIEVLHAICHMCVCVCLLYRLVWHLQMMLGEKCFASA